MTRSKGTKITLGGRSFVIAVKNEERNRLAAAVSMVESQISEVQRNGKVIGLDRCALLAALNIASDLLELHSKTDGIDEINAHINRICSKIDTVINDQKLL